MAYHANPQQTMVVTHLQDLRYDPALIDCPFCQQRIVSDVRKTESDTTWYVPIQIKQHGGSHPLGEDGH